MPQVTEEQALQALSLIPQLTDPADRERATRIAKGYEESQLSAGKPLFPSYYRQQAEETRKTRAMFQDRERHGLDDNQFQEVARTLPDPEKKARFLNEQFLSKVFQRPTSEIRNLGTQYRDEYAIQNWGAPVKTDSEFYQKLGEDMDTEDKVAEWSQSAAMRGLSSIQAWQEIPEELKKSDSFRRREFDLRREYEATADATAERLSPYRQTVAQTVEDLQATMGVETAGAAGEAASFRDFAERLIDIPADDRGLVLSSIIANAGGTEEGKGVVQKLAENFARGASDLGMALPAMTDRTALRQLQSFSNQGAGIVGDASTVEGYIKGLNERLAAAMDSTGAAAIGRFVEGGDTVQPSEEIKAQASQIIEKQMEAIDLAADLKQIAETNIDPARGEHMISRGLYGAARSIPYTLVAMAPGGIAVNMAALTEQSYQTIRRANPDMTREQAMAISAVSGPIMARLEQIPVAILKGKLPTLGQFLNKAVATKGSAALRFGIRTGEGVAVEMVQENLQDLTPFAVQGAVSALNSDMPAVPWGEVYGGKFWETQGELFFATLPLALIGGGAGTVRDFNAARSLMHDQRAVALVIGNEAKASEISEAAEAGNYEKAQSLLREGMRGVKADQSDIMAVRAKAAESLRSDAATKAETITKAESVGVLPSIGRSAEGWSLRFKDDTTRAFATHGEADAARWRHAEESGLNIAEATRSVIQSVESQLETGREVQFTFIDEKRSLLQAVQEGEVSRAGAVNRAGIAEQVGGQASNQDSINQNQTDTSQEIDPEQEYQEAFTASELAALAEDDKLSLFSILGSNKTEFADGVQRTTIKLFKGATPLTVIEEKLEGDASRMIADGRRDWLLTRLRRYERMSGDKLLTKERDNEITDGDLKEAFSHLGQSYFVGRSRKGDVGNRWKSRSFRKAAADLLRSPLGATFEGYSRFFQAVWRRAAKLNKMRREGRLDQELERELARSVGFGEQAEYESAVEAEAAQNRQMLEDAGFEAEPATASDFVPSEDAPFSVIQKGEGYQKTKMPDGMILEGPASFSVIAYHGTPHKVDKFSTEKIGTGEGAQAYGWGLYFAENRDVGEQYRKNLTAVNPRDEAKATVLVGGVEAPKKYSELVEKFGPAKASVIQRVQSLKTLDGWDYNPSFGTESLNVEARAIWQEIKGTLEIVNPRSEGNLYTVELLPDDDEFLDWDKPLSDQSAKVQKALAKLDRDYSPDSDDYDANETGQMVYMRAWENSIRRGKAKPAKEKQEELSLSLNKIGIKGIRYLDGNSRDGGTGTFNYVIFDDSLVRILEENGKPVDESSFSVITNAEDIAYLSAVKSGDMATAQRMVDEAARAAGYDVLAYHGTPRMPFESFNRNNPNAGDDLLGEGFYFSSSEKFAKNYGDIAFNTSSKFKKKGPWTVGDNGGAIGKFFLKAQFRDLGDVDTTEEISSVLRDSFNASDIGNADGVSINHRGQTEYVVYNPNQIKSADPVTYDESGNVIPLSQRFNPARDEITYSVITNADSRISEMFTPFLRNPEQRRKIVQAARERATEKAREWQPILRANRSNVEIERERKTREDEILSEKLDTLSPSEIGALSNDNLLEDNSLRPILSELLTRKSYKSKSGKMVSYWSGALMSKAEAKRRGFDTTGGEWDAIPEGLPPYVWGGSLTPDQAATRFNFERPEDFYDAIASEVESFRARKEEVAAANARIRELEKEAKAESRTWADEQKKLRRTVGTDRATLIGAMRTLDAMISALPSEIRGKVGGFVRLAQFKTPGAMLDELERRANRLDTELERWLKKEADKGVKKLFETAKPAKDEAGKKRVGKAGADIHDLFDVARTAWKNWTSEKAEAHAITLESEVAKGEMTPEAEAHALLEADMVRSFGGWNEADSVRRLHALETAEEIWREGYHAFKLKKAQEKERRDGIRADLQADTGAAGKAGERDLAELAGVKLKGRGKEIFLSLLNFDQLVTWAFGKESKWAKWFADQQRQAENQKIDAVQAVTESVEGLFSELAGGNRFDGEKLQFRMMQKSLEVSTESGDVRKLSELEAITALLMYQQEDGKRHMRGKRDEEGNLTSTWSYGDQFIEDISGQLSPEAWRVLEFLQREYSKEWEPLNAVYSEIYGVNLPRNPNYSPLTVKPQQASGGQTVDPVTGSTLSGGSFTPGSLRSRGVSSAEPEFRDAVATFLAHKKQIEHWKAHAKFILEANAVLGNREVGNSVEAAHGQEATKIIRKWLDALAQGGVRDAASGTALMKLLGNLTGRAASMALVGRIGTLAVQSTQLGAAAATMPTGAYVSRLGKLLSGNLGWGAAFKSEYIQRRLKAQPVMVQQAMEGLKAGKPNQLKHQVRRVGELIGGADAIFTAGTFAMVHDYQFTQAKRNGLSDLEADTFATQEAERVLESIAQPSRMGTRSFFEVSTTNPLGRLAWAFASDARKNAALLGYQYSTGTAADKYRATLFVVALNGLIAGVIRNAWRDMRDDDDEKFFDEKYWNPKRLLLSTGTDWLFGFPVIGEEIQRAIYAYAGEYNPDSGLLSGITQSPGAASRLLTGESEDYLRDVEKILTAAGYFNDSAAASVSVMHLIRDTFGLGKNFTN